MKMVRLALQHDDSFVPSDTEIRKGGVSYTIDTVRRLRKRYGRQVEIWLLMGMDTFVDIPNWKEPEELARECFFGVARRPGYGKRTVKAVPARRTRFVDITAVDISSTDIRERLSQGRSIRFLVPGPVERYIAENTPYHRLVQA
jgi:nicotinate-nucleotide adenylyltransferase